MTQKHLLCGCSHNIYCYRCDSYKFTDEHESVCDHCNQKMVLATFKCGICETTAICANCRAVVAGYKRLADAYDGFRPRKDDIRACNSCEQNYYDTCVRACNKALDDLRDTSRKQRRLKRDTCLELLFIPEDRLVGLPEGGLEWQNQKQALGELCGGR